MATSDDIGKNNMTTIPIAQIQLSIKESARTTRSEIELLLCCARTHMDPITEERIKVLLQQDIDWTYLIQAAARKRVMPLLYRSLNSTCSALVPKSILSQLRNFFHTNAQCNLCLTRELINLLNLLKEHDIPAIPFKGPVLAASVYDNLALRQFSDLDILVHKRDLKKAKKLLLSCGYQLRSKLSWEYDFVNEERGINVDLHFAFTPKYFPFKLDFNDSWENSKPVILANTTILSFQPEDLLLILCAQLAKDFAEDRERLSQLCDIAELLRIQPQMNWEYIMNQAKMLGNQRILFLGIILARDLLLETTLPKIIEEKIQNSPIVKSLAIQVCERLFSNDKSLSSISEGPLFYLKVRERWQDKALYLITPNEEDERFLPLPPFLYFFYYLIRPIKLIMKYSLNLSLFCRTRTSKMGVAESGYDIDKSRLRS